MSMVAVKRCPMCGANGEAETDALGGVWACCSDQRCPMSIDLVPYESWQRRQPCADQEAYYRQKLGLGPDDPIILDFFNLPPKRAYYLGRLVAARELG